MSASISSRAEGRRSQISNPYKFTVESKVSMTQVKRGQGVPVDVSFTFPDLPAAFHMQSTAGRKPQIEVLLSATDGALNLPESQRIRGVRNRPNRSDRSRDFVFAIDLSEAKRGLRKSIQFTPTGNFGARVRGQLLINGVVVARAGWGVVFDSKGRGREILARDLIREHRTRINQGKLPNAGYVIPPLGRGR
ncbi:hypothetical protein WDW86_16460 [Bdellovibrionota bacterium FG-2]